ncbi:hypothetical protein CVT24_004943 [Panaeolus cyanescens]|uniref:Small ribosomal subunit protein bS18m n=1 Tax=Panaeolus cyanescens TaxID=181874 RepID=A0A409V9L8_9AGAR|nr:hypothetical protein CVT24_004943 [Panaeolus cyanescens]
MLACRRQSPAIFARVSNFTTSSCLRQQQGKKNNGMQELSGMLKDVKTPVLPQKSTGPPKWKSYQLNRILQPFDLTYKSRVIESKPFKRVTVAPPSSVARHSDIFYQLNLNPRQFTTNPVVLAEYLSEMGKIQGRESTFLTAKNQRALAKTIRRAKMMGLIPNLSMPRVSLRR